MLPVIVVILSTLGVILAGIATPTDAGAVGACCTFVLTVGSRRMSLAKIRTATVSTLEISSMILLLVTASNLFGSVFSRLGSADFLAQVLTSLALPPMLMLIVILALIFVLGWPLEWVPIVLIVLPIVLPIVQAARHRPDLVLHAGGGDAADGLAVAAGGAVGLFPRRAWCRSGR